MRLLTKLQPLSIAISASPSHAIGLLVCSRILMTFSHWCLQCPMIRDSSSAVLDVYDLQGDSWDASQSVPQLGAVCCCFLLTSFVYFCFVYLLFGEKATVVMLDSSQDIFSRSTRCRYVLLPGMLTLVIWQKLCLMIFLSFFLSLINISEESFGDSANMLIPFQLFPIELSTHPLRISPTTNIAALSVQWWF